MFNWLWKPEFIPHPNLYKNDEIFSNAVYKVATNEQQSLTSMTKNNLNQLIKKTPPESRHTIIKTIYNKINLNKKIKRKYIPPTTFQRNIDKHIQNMKRLRNWHPNKTLSMREIEQASRNLNLYSLN